MDNEANRKTPPNDNITGARLSAGLPWCTTEDRCEFRDAAPHSGSDVDGNRTGASVLVETGCSDLSQEAVRDTIAFVCDELKSFLLGKNAAYGNSALEPINVFSKLPPKEGILLRIDDKLKRIKNGTTYVGDNDLKDLTGYLILLLVLMELTDE